MPALLILRGLRRRAQRDRLTLDRLVRGVFIPLGEREGREIALGLVGRFWTPSAGGVVRPLAAVAREAMRWTGTRPV